MDYFGPVVNKTARICNAAEGGQILISQDVERAFKSLIGSPQFSAYANQALPEESGTRRTMSNAERSRSLVNFDHVFMNAGERKLKGLENPEMLVSVLPRALVSRFKIPPPPIPGETASLPTVPTSQTNPEIFTEHSNSTTANSLDIASLIEKTGRRLSVAPIGLSTIEDPSSKLNLSFLSEEAKLLHYCDRIELVVYRLLYQQIINLQTDTSAEKLAFLNSLDSKLFHAYSDDSASLSDYSKSLLQNSQSPLKIIEEGIIRLERLTSIFRLLETDALRAFIDVPDETSRRDRINTLEFLLQCSTKNFNL
jgi:hypothetical protein